MFERLHPDPALAGHLVIVFQSHGSLRASRDPEQLVIVPISACGDLRTGSAPVGSSSSASPTIFNFLSPYSVVPEHMELCRLSCAEQSRHPGFAKSAASTAADAFALYGSPGSQLSPPQILGRRGLACPARFCLKACDHRLSVSPACRRTSCFQLSSSLAPLHTTCYSSLTSP